MRALLFFPPCGEGHPDLELQGGSLCLVTRPACRVFGLRSCRIAGSRVGAAARRKVKTLFGHGGCILNSVSAACSDGARDAHSTGEVKLLFWFVFLVT